MFNEDISITRDTGAHCIDEIQEDLKQELKAITSMFEQFPIAIDEIIDGTGITQLADFIRACGNELNIYDQIIELLHIHGPIESQDTFKEVEHVQHGYRFNLSSLAGLSTDDSANIVGKYKSGAAKL